MAALASSSPIAGTVVGFEGRGACGSSNADSPQTVAFLLDRSLNSGKQQCSSSSSTSLVGWSRSSLGGEAVEKNRVQQRQQRQQGRPALLIRAEAKEESFFQSIGSQFFKVGGAKPESKATKDDSDSRSGTPFFGLGGKKKKEEAPEEPKSGTQFFKFGSTNKGASETSNKAASGTTKKAATGTTKKGATGTQAGTTNGSALAVRTGTTALQTLSFGRGRRVDPKTVFVAGATGQIGARISQQLLRAGFNVRAGVPDLYVAQQLAEFATQYGVISRDEAKRLNAVEFDFKNVSSIAKGLGNAGKVVVTIGPTEDGPQGKVTTDDASRVLEAATVSNAAHFVLVTDPGLGVRSDNGPLAGLAALFGRVFSKAAEISDSDLIAKIVETGLPYTIIKAGSTDGVDDYAPEGGNLVVEAEGASDPSAKVSKIQVAATVAGVFQYTGVSENKFFEVTSNPYAPSRPVDELLSAIQVDGRRAILQEERARLSAEAKERELRSKVDAEAKEATEDARRAAQLASQLEAEAKRLSAEEAKAAAVAAKAQARADAAAASVDGLQVKAKELGGNPLKISGTASFKVDDKIKNAFFPKKQQPAPQPVPAAASAAPKSGGFFGGLFGSQESVYVDDD